MKHSTSLTTSNIDVFHFIHSFSSIQTNIFNVNSKRLNTKYSNVRKTEK